MTKRPVSLASRSKDFSMGVPRDGFELLQATVTSHLLSHMGPGTPRDVADTSDTSQRNCKNQRLEW